MASFEVGGYVRGENTWAGPGRVYEIVSVTPTGLPRIRDTKGRAVVLRGGTPATRAEYEAQMAAGRHDRHREALRLGAGPHDTDHNGRATDAGDASRDLACAAWLRYRGWTVTAPDAPPHEGARVLAVMRDLHGDGALADVYDIQPDCEADLDEAVTRWAAAGYPGAGDAS